MDANTFQKCKEQVKASILNEIERVINDEWDKIISAVYGCCDTGEKFNFGIGVDLTPGEDGISNAVSLKYKAAREVSGEMGFTRYDGMEQSDLFKEAETLLRDLEHGRKNAGWDSLEAFVQDVKESILETKRASIGILVRKLKISPDLALKALDHLTNEGFLGPVKGDEPRDILQNENPAMEGNPNE